MQILVQGPSEVISRVDTATLPVVAPTPLDSPRPPLEGLGKEVAALHGLFLGDWAHEVAWAYRFGRIDRPHYDGTMDTIEGGMRRIIPGFLPSRLPESMRLDFTDPLTRAAWISANGFTHHTDRYDFDAVPEEAGDLERFAVWCRQLGRRVGSVEWSGEEWEAYHGGDLIGEAPTRTAAVALVCEVQEAIRVES